MNRAVADAEAALAIVRKASPFVPTETYEYAVGALERLVAYTRQVEADRDAALDAERRQRLNVTSVPWVDG